MSFLRSHWYRMLAVAAGPLAMLFATAVAHADDIMPH
jgi:hypothetical protein